ncbi:hypothetical protein ACFL04_02280, partial [Patescibacteria group bacterium]
MVLSQISLSIQTLEAVMEDSFSTQTVAITVTAEDIRTIPDPSPEFKRWVWERYFFGGLDLVVQATISAGKADTIAEALAYLCELSREHQQNNTAISVADLERRVVRSHRSRELEKLVTGQTTSRKSAHLYHGLIGHQAIHELMTGALVARKLDQANSIQDDPQNNLFAGLLSADQSQQEDRRRQRVQELSTLMRRIKYNWRTALKKVDTSSWKLDSGQGGSIWRLDHDLSTLFGKHLRRLKQYGKDPDGYLTMMTLMSWAATVIYYRRRRRNHVLFRELPVIAHRHRIGGGRVDAIEILTIGGRKPNRNQLRILAQLSRSQFKSTGHLIQELSKIFRQHLDIAVIDWKFLVGDILQSGQDMIAPDVSTKPIAEHVKQLRRYLTMIPFDHHLGAQNAKLWDTKDFTLHGQLWYLLPSGPVIHEIAMTSVEREQRFLDDVVSNYPIARRRASVRSLDNLVMGHLVGILAGNGGKRLIRQAVNNVSPQYTLLPVSEMARTAVDVIEEQRNWQPEFVDDSRVIEIVGNRNGRPIYHLHLDALLQVIESGEVRTWRFGDDGGKVSCLMPDHHDDTPSMSVKLTANPPIWHCFGCNAGGHIALESIPQHLISFLSSEWGRPENRNWVGGTSGRAKLPVIPEEHHQIMS